MSRSADDAHGELTSLLPTGWIWPRQSDDSLLHAVLKPAATLVSEIEATAEAMMEEIDPRTAYHTLGDFERVLGPDPCGRDPATMTVAERQLLAHQRWTARGGQSIAYYTELAARRGVAIHIEEFRICRAGVMRAGDLLINHPEQFTWLVRLQLGTFQIFRAGASVAGDLLYEIDLDGIECDLRRLAPEHTQIVFHYLPAVPDNVVTLYGEALTLAGEYVTLAEQ